MKIQLDLHTTLKGNGFSAIDYHEGKFIVIADNTEAIFELDRAGNFLGIQGDNTQLAKKSKPDYEAATFISWNGKSYFMRMASGSTENRHKLSLVDWETKEESIFSLANFYAFYQKIANLNLAEINIEALVFQKDSLLIFNRANNQMLNVKLDSFFHCLQHADFEPEIRVQSLSLGTLNGCPLGISGACSLGNSIYFTASAERTENWYDDGEIEGSCIGCIALDEDFQITDLKQVEFKNENDLMRTKLEGITCDESHFYLISDNDEQASEFFKVRIIG